MPSGEPNYGCLTTVPDEKLIELISAGESFKNIGEKLGCSPQAIHQHIENKPHIKIAQRTGYVSRMERREAEMESAREQVDVSRTRELLGHARWLAERGDPERWGAKATLDVKVDLGGALAAISERMQARTIEHDATQQIDDATDVDSQPVD